MRKPRRFGKKRTSQALVIPFAAAAQALEAIVDSGSRITISKPVFFAGHWRWAPARHPRARRLPPRRTAGATGDLAGPLREISRRDAHVPSHRHASRNSGRPSQVARRLQSSRYHVSRGAGFKYARCAVCRRRVDAFRHETHVRYVWAYIRRRQALAVAFAQEPSLRRAGRIASAAVSRALAFLTELLG